MGTWPRRAPASLWSTCTSVASSIGSSPEAQFLHSVIVCSALSGPEAGERSPGQSGVGLTAVLSGASAERRAGGAIRRWRFLKLTDMGLAKLVIGKTYTTSAALPSFAFAGCAAACSALAFAFC